MVRNANFIGDAPGGHADAQCIFVKFGDARVQLRELRVSGPYELVLFHQLRTSVAPWRVEVDPYQAKASNNAPAYGDVAFALLNYPWLTSDADIAEANRWASVSYSNTEDTVRIAYGRMVDGKRSMHEFLLRRMPAPDMELMVRFMRALPQTVPTVDVTLDILRKALEPTTMSGGEALGGVMIGVGITVLASLVFGRR